MLTLLIDFGLAKEIRPEERVDDDLYKMSGNTGSLRYMAPEVALEKPYNRSVDVYSFGILFWQITSLETPFTGFSVNMHNDRVVRGGLRPKLDPKMSPGLLNLMKNSWSENIHYRPTFQEITEVLRNEVSVLRGDSECILGKKKEILFIFRAIPPSRRLSCSRIIVIVAILFHMQMHLIEPPSRSSFMSGNK